MAQTDLNIINEIAQRVKEYLIKKGIPEVKIKVYPREQESDNGIVDDVVVEDNHGGICESYRIKPFRCDDTNCSSHLVFEASIQDDKLKLDTDDTFCIKSVADYLQKLKTNLRSDNDIVHFYRGHSDLFYDNLPQIYRPIERGSDTKFVEKESILFKQAVLECSSDFPSTMSTFDMLAKMRHFELPTRLLDISKNPLVGLFFASLSHPDRDGEVLVYKIPKNEISFFDSDKVYILANIAKQKDTEFFVPDLPCKTVAEIKAFNEAFPMGYLLHDIRNERMDFLPIIRKNDMQSVICVMPRKNSERIQAQDGAFFIYGILGKKSECAVNPYIPTRFIVKGNDKKAILDELKHLSIDEPHLFPSLNNRLTHIKNNFAEY